MTSALGTKAATVSHEGIEYDLYEDDGALWSVALAGSDVDLVDVLKLTVISKLEDLLTAEFIERADLARQEYFESIAEDRRLALV